MHLKTGRTHDSYSTTCCNHAERYNVSTSCLLYRSDHTAADWANCYFDSTTTALRNAAQMTYVTPSTLRRYFSFVITALKLEAPTSSSHLICVDIPKFPHKNLCNSCDQLYNDNGEVGQKYTEQV